MAQLNKTELAAKLLKQRRLAPDEQRAHTNGNNGIETSSDRPNGHGESKLAEAGRYLKAARIYILTVVRDNYREADNVDANTDHVRELLDMAQSLENLRARVDVKASILGR